MSNTFFIGDLHLGHKKVCKFEPTHRPFDSVEEHDEAIINNWNSVVRERDLVWVLGDVAFGKESLKLMDRMSGKKKLILGNHDHYPVPLYLEHFESVHAMREKSGNIFTHIPIHTSQMSRWRVNIHGHMHSNSLDDDRYCCISAERIDMRPISIEDLRNLIATEDK